MNINRDIANRALEAAGQERLNEEDIEKESARWRLIKDNYLSVIEYTLSKTTWTSRLKRAKLEKIDISENLSNYMNMYLLPIDCAKPEALKDNGEYVVEERILYTDTEDASLLYVSDNKTGKVKYVEAEPQPDEETFEEGKYYYKPEPTEEDPEPDLIMAETFEEGITYFVELEEEIPGYDEIDFDPSLREYIELQLAAKLALKITGDTNTFQMLYNQALIIENKAQKTTLEHAHSKEQGEEWWGNLIGLSVEGK